MVIGTHREIQEKLLNKSILVFGIIVIPTLVTSLLLGLDMGWQPAFTVNILAAVVILIVAIYRKAITYQIKTLFLVTVYYIIAVSSTLNFGLNGFLLEFLMLSVFIGVIFWGKKQANTEIKKLQGILPICSNCKKIRDSGGYWNQVESYIESCTEAKFSHGLCEECLDKLYGKEKWYRQKYNKPADGQI